MKQEISFSSLAAIPDDYQAPDGQLDVSLNVISEDNHLKPLAQPRQILSLDEGEYVLCIHQTAEFKHFICYDSNNNLFYIDNSSINFNPVPKVSLLNSPFAHTIIKATPIGNTLCLLCKDGIQYFLWTRKNTGNSYSFIGDHLPEIRLSFGLQCDFVYDAFEVSFKGETGGYNGICVPTKAVGDGIEQLTNTVLAHVNKMLNDTVLGSDRFCAPFFLRYALRLFDGSLTCQSAPILMMPSYGNVPIVNTLGSASVETNNIVRCTLIALAPACKLTVQAQSLPKSFNKFYDIIQSVDIFVSAPFYSYDPDGKCEVFCSASQTRQQGFFALDEDAIDNRYNTQSEETVRGSLKKHSRWNLYDAINAEYGFDGNSVFGWTLKLPEKDNFTVSSQMDSCANFYLLKSIPIESLDTQRNTVDVEKGLLKSLLSRETLDDDYDSHDTILADNAFVFNSRLYLTGIRKKLFNGYLNASFAETLLGNLSFAQNKVTSVEELSCFTADKVFVYINRDGRNIIVQEDANILFSAHDTALSNLNPTELFVPFFYYPDPNAYQVEIYHRYHVNHGEYWRVLVLPLRRHQTLNGAFYFDDFKKQTITISTSLPTASADSIVPLPGKLYSSEVNNPFFFPLLGINTVGNGSLLGLATVTEPLSQGQFGYADIYIFASDGIWVAQISQEGKISNINPLNRDVCNNPDSITQLGSSILYTTNRGIMQLFGRNTECISDSIANEHPLDFNSLPKISQLPTFNFQISSFSSFLSGCRMLYDYIHQHVIVFNPDFSYAYVFSLRSKLWGMMNSKLKSAINSYPECLAMQHSNSLVSFDNYSNNNPVKATVVSRPLKFNAPDTLKSVYEIIIRGVFTRGNVTIVLYGSRNLVNWYLVASSATQHLCGSRGTPYKYFRIVIVATLDENHSLDGASVILMPRQTQRLH